MLSRNRVSMEFTPGECVLCFEPDLTKARVLYNAKVIDVMMSKDSKGRRRAEYMVHFQGWNSSWDRVVPENYIIKNSDRNRSLMRRLAEIARHVKKNKSRMRRIDNILKEHFQERPRFDSDSSSESSSSDDGKSEDDDEEDDDDDDENSEDDPSNSETDNDDHFMNGNGHFGPNGLGDEIQEAECDCEDTEYKEIELELPGNLRRKLEYDCVAINHHQKLVKLPAETNIITLLEGYVKNFGVNVLCATVEKSRPYRNDEPKPPEKNIDLCKEVMDGLRVFFDFALPTILLYNTEKDQWEKLMSLNKPIVHVKTEDSQSDVKRPQFTSQCSSPARQSPRAACKYDDEYSDDDEGPPRRITRKAFAEELRRSSLKSQESPKVNTTDTSENTPGHSASKRPRQTPDSAKKSDTKTPRQRKRFASDRSSQSAKSAGRQETPGLKVPTPASNPAPTIPIITTHGCASSVSSNADTPTSSAIEQSFFRHREQAVNDIFSWRMLPDEEYRKVPTPPSLIYGAIHLLRLFVNLPEYLGRMPFPRTRLKHLVKHLELFIEYLSTHCNELFPDTLYVEDDD